ncbi:hypothetical protein Tsubulata_013933, partial [Turnera subulata]
NNHITRLTTFSKRRLGITKKVSELATLTGAHVDVVSYSPIGKPYAFDSPPLQLIIDLISSTILVRTHCQTTINSLNQHLDQLKQKLEEGKKKGKIMKKKLQGVERNGWWEAKVEYLQKPELLELEKNLKSFMLNMSTPNFVRRV